MPALHPALSRARAFCDAHGLRVPILMAPMAGACPVSLALAVANAGGLGACGALMMQPDAIRAWGAEARAGGNGAFQMNLWIPDPPPVRDAAQEAAVRTFLNQWGPSVPPEAADAVPWILPLNATRSWMSGRPSFPRSWGFTRPIWWHG
jgi:nitronate monooxygenase